MSSIVDQYEPWFLDYFEGELEEFKKTELEQAFSQSSELERAYQEFVYVFEVMSSDCAEAFELPANFKQEVLEKLPAQVNNKGSKMKKEKKGFSIFSGWSINRALQVATTCCFIFLLGLTIITLMSRDRGARFETVGSSVAGIDSDGESAPTTEKLVSKKPARGELAQVASAPAEQVKKEIASTKSNTRMPGVKPTKSFSDGLAATSSNQLESTPSPAVFQKKEQTRVARKGVKTRRDVVAGDIAGAATGGLARKQMVFTEESKAVWPVPPSRPIPRPEPIPASKPQSEGYDQIVENVLTLSKEDPLSTFSIDVDTASYSNLRRVIQRNSLPQANAIRVEEMVNYFKYDYPVPKDKTQPFSINTELSTVPWNAERQLLRIGLKGYDLSKNERQSSNLVFLVDVSGSMQGPNKLELLKRSLKLMVSELGNEDRIALVAYAGSSSIILDSTSTENKAKINSAIDNLKSGGSTAGGAGIRMAYDTARRNFLQEGNNRVILATDGDFNVGLSNHQELVNLVEKERESGVFLSVLGFGTGNYQDGKMEQLSNHGNGNYFYIDSMLEAKKVLLQDLTGTLFAIAKDVKIQVEFNPERVKAFRLVGYENRKLAHKDFSNDLKDAGELGAGHTVTALYEIVPAGSKESLAETPTLKYGKKTEGKEQVMESSKFANEVATVKLRYKLPKEDKSKLLERTVKTSDIKQFFETENDFRFQTAVVEFGLLLRNSVAKGKSSFEAVIKRAKASKGTDEFGYRADFIKLVESAQLLSKTK